MSHMQPDVSFASYFEVDTTHGIEIVPTDVVNRTIDVTGETLLNYLSGAPLDKDATIEPKTGWLARLSAPGYMDCTDWTAHATEAEARAYLEEQYGDQ